MRKFISCVSALAVIAATSSPAFAAVTVLGSVDADAADGPTLAGMTTQCNALAAAHIVPGSQDRWSAEVVEGDVNPVSGPTLSATPNKNIDDSTVQGFDFHPSVTQIEGDPKRNGGSVNMFGLQIATAGYYDYSTFDFTADYDSVFSHGFSCDISVEVYHPAVTLHHPAVGVYVVDPDAHGNEEAKQNSCNAFTAMQPEDPLTGPLTPPWWGQPQGQCLFSGAAAYDQVIPAFYGDPDLVSTEPGVAINQGQTDNLLSHEDHGPRVELTGARELGVVVVCISPSSGGTKLPGAWKKQNGYTGDKCTTEWFKGGATIGVINLNPGRASGVTVPLI